MIFAGGLYTEADAPHDRYHRLLEVRPPVVLVNAAGEKLGFPQVSTDDAVAAEQAFAHLLSVRPAGPPPRRADRPGPRRAPTGGAEAAGGREAARGPDARGVSARGRGRGGRVRGGVR